MSAIDPFIEPARRAGIALVGSVMLLKSVAMIRYMNHMGGVPKVPDGVLDRMARSPVKMQAGMEAAAALVRELRGRGMGVLVTALGWGGRLPEFLDLVEREGRDGARG
jgi:hypothetical protein